MKKNKIVKNLMILVLVLSSAVLLTACGGKKDEFPLGDIGDTIYVSAGSHEITERELYEEFRFEGLDILLNMIDDRLFAEYYNKVDYNNEDHREVIEKEINKTVFGMDDIEKLEESYRSNEAVKEQRVKSFVDNLVIAGKILPTEKDALVNELIGTTSFENYSNELLDLYKAKMVAKLFAQEKLDEEIEDEESKQYIKDSEIVTYYKNNRKGQYEVTAFYTEFLNLNEQRAVFRQLSIKISSSGKWFLVPDIRIIDEEDIDYIDVLNDPDYSHVKSILESKKIKYVDENNERVEISKDDYETYYNAYSFDENRTSNPDSALEPQEVLEYIIQAHNLTHAEQLEVVDASEGIIRRVDGDEIQTVFEYDDFDNTQLRSHIYTSLSLPTEDDPKHIQYSQRANAFGDYAYLAYKFADESETQEGVLNDDEDEFLEGNDDLIAELKAEIIEKRLTDAYISTKLNDHVAENKVSIYDPILRTLYSSSNEYDGATKIKDQDTLVEIGEITITVREFYEEAEKFMGINIAGDLLTHKILKDKYYREITADEHKANREQMDQMIVAFGQNQYAASGYPASMGRKQFLLLAFRADTVEEAIETAFVQPKLKELYIKDIENHYDDIYEKYAYFSKKQYDNYWALKASHLLIYLDLDLDGSPDNPNLLDEETLAEMQEILPEFIGEIMNRIGKEVSESKGIDRLITDYNNSTRLASDDKYDDEYIWAKYRRFGFKLKQETLGDITNSSNFLSSSSRLDEVFYERAVALREIVKEYETAQFPYLDFFSGEEHFDPADPESEDNLEKIEKIQTDFGWHLIMATSYDDEMTSAKLEIKGDDDTTHLSKIEVDGVKLSGVNENDWVNATQIEIYLKESASEYTVQIRAKAAIEKQFSGVQAKYNSKYMQSELIYRLLIQEGISFTKQTNNSRLLELRAINQVQLFDYQLGTNDAFDAIWGDWFDKFK